MFEFLTDLQFWAYVSIPFVSALVGWGTNVVALKMTFYPIKPFGWPPYFGWQGIIPSKAQQMAERSVDLMTTQLINIDDIVDRLDAEQIKTVLLPVVQEQAERILDELIEDRAAKWWHSVPQPLKDRIYARTREGASQIILDVVNEAKSRSAELFDLKRMVVDSLMRDKALLNRIFLECGLAEFKFIERSGFILGFLFGLIQMTIWIFYPAWWALPAAGFFVGYATNWIALKMIFQPLQPRRIGPWIWQGLFLKRQKEVSVAYAGLVSSEILNAKNMLNAIVRGPTSDKLFDIIQHHVKESIDTHGGFATQFVEVAVGSEDYNKIKDKACTRIFEEVPEQAEILHDYADRALDIERTLREKMSALSSVKFSGLLRPIFQEDELKLILVGAALGVAIGFVQLFAVFGGI